MMRLIRSTSRALLSSLFLLLLSLSVSAENYYLLQVDYAEVSDKELQVALKQIQQLKELELQEIAGLPPFHQRQDALDTEEHSFCLNCHLALPHRENERQRTFLNMHSRYVACETCHLKSDKQTTLKYRWLAFNQPHAGLEVVALAGEGGSQESAPFLPIPGARIAPFVGDEPAVLFEKSHSAKRTLKEWETSDELIKAKLKARLHAPLQKEGPACEACHNEKSMLDLVMLGANPIKKRQIEQNGIARFFARFNEQTERLRITDMLR
jgi:hypothetical protein